MKTCGTCRFFRPSPYNPKTGNGGCLVLEKWEAKHKERGTFPTDQAVKAAYIEIGGRFGEASALCHPKQDRDRCKRYTKIDILLALKNEDSYGAQAANAA